MNTVVCVSWSLIEASSAGFKGDNERLTDLAMALDSAIIAALPCAFKGNVGETGHGPLDETFAVIHGDLDTAQVVLSEWGDSDGGDLHIHGTVTSAEIERILNEIEDMDRDDWGDPAHMFRICMDFVTINGARFNPLQGDEDDYRDALG